MLQGTIIEESLENKAVLKELNILKSWTGDDWKLHQVSLNREQALELGKYLDDGPWYMHFWEPGKDEILVVYKHKTFDIKYSDKATWQDAVEYGKSINIPEKQLTFLIY